MPPSNIKRGVGVRNRTFLPVVASATLILTLFFAAAAGAQETTATDTTATPTADPVQEATTANSNADRVRDEGSFRCDFFLRQVSDEDGALLRQYRRGDGDDELIVQRFEQCVSGDVLADTIPDRKLPFTGGMPLIGLAAIGLASLVAGVAVLRAVMRRAR
jgi:hypothetical protein